MENQRSNDNSKGITVRDIYIIYNVREQGEGGLNQGCLVLAVTLHNNLGFLNASFMQDLLSLCSVKGCTDENIQ